MKIKVQLTLEPHGFDLRGSPLKRAYLSINTLEIFLEICDNLKNSEKDGIA